VAIEVHHVVGAARIGRLVQHLGQPGEGGRAQHVQVQALHPGGAAAGQPAGHRPERHIITAARTADHQKHPQPVPARLRHPGPGRGLQVSPHEHPRPQRQRRAGARVPHQLPWQPRHLGRVGIHLHSHLPQPGLRPVPDPRRIPPGKHAGEQPSPGLRQDRLSTGGLAGRRVRGKLREVLQVPADLLRVLVTDLVGERGHRHLPGVAVLP